MSNATDRKFWPFKPRTSIAATILILVSLLLIFVVLRLTIEWPSQKSETTVLIGMLLFSLLPVFLSLVDVIIERGGVIAYGRLKIDFSRVSKMETTGLTVPVNIGVPGKAVTEGTTEILDALRQATTCNVVIIDIEQGQAWWETRLLVLLAGADRLKKPEKVVFVGTDGGNDKCFQGWGYSSDLLPCLLRAEPQYLRSFHAARSAARQCELVEPVNLAKSGNLGQKPDQPTWIQPGLASSYFHWAFDDAWGLPYNLFAERLLATDLGEKIERKEQPKALSLIRLEDLFRPVLHKECVDEGWDTERQISVFFDNDSEYIAVTQNGKYKTLTSRLTVLSAIVRQLVEKK